MSHFYLEYNGIHIYIGLIPCLWYNLSVVFINICNHMQKKKFKPSMIPIYVILAIAIISVAFLIVGGAYLWHYSLITKIDTLEQNQAALLQKLDKSADVTYSWSTVIVCVVFRFRNNMATIQDCNKFGMYKKNLKITPVNWRDQFHTITSNRRLLFMRKHAG